MGDYDTMEPWFLFWTNALPLGSSDGYDVILLEKNNQNQVRIGSFATKHI